MKTNLQMTLVWLLMLVFSWLYMAQKLNQHNQNLAQQLAQGTLNLDWSLSSLTDIVSSFHADWQLVDGGVKSHSAQSEVSFYMPGERIDPAIHDQLVIEATTDFETTGKFKIELSDQVDAQFFDSPEIAISQLNQPIDLKALEWRINSPSDQNQVLAWNQLPTLDALVVRFYLNADANITLTQVTVKQSSLAKTMSINAQDCLAVHATSKIQCWLTNSMRFQHQQSLKQGLTSHVNFAAPTWSPDWLLWLSCAIVIWTVRGLVPEQAPNHAIWLTVFLAAIPLVIWALHQNWVADFSFYLKGLLVVGALSLVWSYRSCLKWPQSGAYPLILLTLLLVLGALWVKGFEFKFLAGLPFYFAWAWIQQLLLGPVVSSWVKHSLGVSDIRIAFIVGVLFSIIHAPNHVLMLATMAAGVVWSYSWLRYQNLYANSFSHAMLALVFYQVMPEAWLGSARIGVFF